MFFNYQKIFNLSLKISFNILIIICTVIIFIITPIEYIYSQDQRGQASAVHGKVESRRNISRFREVRQGKIFRSGDIIQTASDGLLEIILFNGIKIRIYRNTKVNILQLTDKSIYIRVFYGKIFLLNNTGKSYPYKITSQDIIIESQSINYQLYIENNSKSDFLDIINLDGHFSAKNDTYSESLKLSEISDYAIPKYISFKSIKKNKISDNSIPNSDNDLLDKQGPLSTYDPQKSQVYRKKDPWWTEKKTFKKRSIDIKKFREQKKIYFQFETGAQHISDNFYFLINLQPKINLENFQAQLRIPVYFIMKDPLAIKKSYNYNEWNFKDTKDIIDDLFSKIDYISLRLQKGKVQFLLSPIEDKTLGYGMIFQRYSNSILFPYERLLGLSFNFNYKSISFEGFIRNITTAKLIGMRIETRPFTFSDEDSVDQYKFGISFNTDLDPAGNGGSPQIFLASIDANIPILFERKKPFHLSLFAEVSIQGYNFNDQLTAAYYAREANKLIFKPNSFGILFGLRGTIKDNFKLIFQYRYLVGGYISEYFDVFYEINRNKKFELILLDNKNNYNGLLFGMGYNIPGIGNIYSELYYETGEISGHEKIKNRFHFEISSSQELIPYFKLKASYDRLNSLSFKDFFEDFLGDKSILMGEVRYAISKNFDIIFIYRNFFEKQASNYNHSSYISLSTQFIF